MESFLKCKKCKKDFYETDVELHHIIPKGIGGEDLDGRIYLCKKHHGILQNLIWKWIWESIPENLKNPIKDKIKEKTEGYLNDYGTTEKE